MLDRDRQIQDKIKDIAEANGAELIDFRIFFHNGVHIVRSVVDYLQGNISINACAVINKKVCGYLDESSLLGLDFSVEINSPGLDRPLKDFRDFVKIKGRVVSLWLNEPTHNKEFLEGEIIEVDEEKLLLKMKDEILTIDLKKIKLGKEKIKWEKIF